MCVIPHLHASCVGLVESLSFGDRFVGGNRIGDIGAGKLAEALPHLVNLKAPWLGRPQVCVDPSFRPRHTSGSITQASVSTFHVLAR